MKRFAELQNVIDEFALTNSDFHVSEDEWKIVEEMNSVLRNVDVITKRIQTIQYTLSDLYGDWILLELKLKNYVNVELARNLLNEMNSMEARLINNETMISAIFLDPRFQVELTDAQCEIAIFHLEILYNRIIAVEEHIVDANLVETIHVVDESNELEMFLKQKEMIRNASSARHTAELDVKSYLYKFKNIKRENQNKSVLMYWETMKSSEPQLYKLARVVFSVPSSQCTVERSFSDLSFILSDRRCNLNDRNLENILSIRLNKEIFEIIRHEA